MNLPVFLRSFLIALIKFKLNLFEPHSPLSFLLTLLAIHSDYSERQLKKVQQEQSGLWAHQAVAKNDIRVKEILKILCLFFSPFSCILRKGTRNLMKFELQEACPLQLPLGSQLILPPLVFLQSSVWILFIYLFGMVKLNGKEYLLLDVYDSQSTDSNFRKSCDQNYKDH